MNVHGQMINGKWIYDKEFVTPTNEDCRDLDIIIQRFSDPTHNCMPFDWFLCEAKDCDVTIYTDASKELVDF